MKKVDKRATRESHAMVMFGADTRGRILRGTAVAVAHRGVRATTVQHILDAAEVSRRTFYKFFKSAEDALGALFEVSTNLFAGTIQMASSAETEPMERIVSAVDAYLDLQQVGGRLIMELQLESLRSDSELAPRRERLFDMLVDLFLSNVTPILERKVDPLVVRGAMLSLEGLVLYLQRDGVFDDIARARVRQVFLASMSRALGVPARHEFELPEPPP